MHLYIFIIPGILMQLLRILDEVSSGSHRPQLVLPLNEITTLGNHKPNFSKEVSIKVKRFIQNTKLQCLHICELDLGKQQHPEDIN